jgi:peptidoglycan/xylan/chitin deacetylase (PgdA/CDA1 family)
MDRAEMLCLNAQGFEIGAHGVSHPNLPHCDKEQLAGEVESSKECLEDDLGKQVSMFAYPNGRHNANVIASVKRAGFVGARTTAMLARGLDFDPFRMPTSVQAYPHSRFEYLKNIATARAFERTWGYLSRLSRAREWVILAMLLFDMVAENGGVWHLYGHSWEVNDFRLWDELKVVLDYVSNRPGVLYLPNSEVVKIGRVQSVGEALPHNADLKVQQ